MNLSETGEVIGSRDVTSFNLTPNDLMALSQRHNREYALVQFRDGTQWLYSGPVGGGEVHTIGGKLIVRNIHTEPGFSIPGQPRLPSLEDVQSYLLHKNKGGGGLLEIATREVGTGRTVVTQYNYDQALNILFGYWMGAFP